MGYFVVITLCFIFSLASKKVALMPGSDSYTCLRYGDWQGHEELCGPGGMLPKWLLKRCGQEASAAHRPMKLV